MDRMLAAHPEIEVLEEKSLFAPLHQEWSEPGALEALADVSDAQIADAREIYRRELDRQRREPNRPLVIDKLPQNLAYLFLIHRLFPEAHRSSSCSATRWMPASAAIFRLSNWLPPWGTFWISRRHRATTTR